MDISDVSYPPGSVLSVEKVANILLPSLANGFDGYGNHTLQALEYLMERFGPVASFTGTGKADRWRLTVFNRHPQDPGIYTCCAIDMKHYLRILSNDDTFTLHLLPVQNVHKWRRIQLSQCTRFLSGKQHIAVSD